MAANQATASKPLASMTKLSRFVSVYEPEASGTAPTAHGNDSSAPRLIVLASWMDGRDVHIAKYVTQYQQLYPTARILLLKTSMSHMWWPSEARKDSKHAVSYIRSLMDAGVLSADPPAKPEILVHLCSNGGIWTVRFMLEEYRARTKQAFPLYAAIYDSAPGEYDWDTSYNALIAGVPKGPARWVVAPALLLLDATYWVWVRVLGLPYDLLSNGEFHNDRVEVRQSNRTYFYGEADEMVASRQLLAHGQRARDKGYVVRTENFGRSPHVAHARTDGERYWRVVKETWETACK